MRAAVLGWSIEKVGCIVQGVFVISLGGQLGKKLMGWLPVSSLYMINVFYAMMVLINLMGCAWLFTAEKEGAHDSWLTDVGGDPVSSAISYSPRLDRARSVDPAFPDIQARTKLTSVSLTRATMGRF